MKYGSSSLYLVFLGVHIALLPFNYQFATSFRSDVQKIAFLDFNLRTVISASVTSQNSSNE